MNRYKRRLIYASIAIHVLALLAYFVYWLNTDPFAEKEKVAATQSSNQLAEGEKNEHKGTTEEIPDTGKNPLEDYEDGDLSDKKITSLLENQIKKNEHLTTQEKVDNLNKELKGISRTSVKDVERMTKLATRAFGANEEKSNNPLREAKPGEIDADSVVLHDFKVIDGKYSLIYKDKNNLTLTMPPVEYEDIDPSEKIRITLIKKGKENKKFKLLLDATNSIINKISPQESEKDSEK